MKIRYNRANIYSCEGVRLLPGVNLVDDKVWEKAAKHAAVKSRIRMGAIVVDSELEFNDELTAEDVAELSDMAMLNELANGRKNSPLTKAAKSRIAEIEAAAKLGDDEEGNE